MTHIHLYSCVHLYQRSMYIFLVRQPMMSYTITNHIFHHIIGYRVIWSTYTAMVFYSVSFFCEHAQQHTDVFITAQHGTPHIRALPCCGRCVSPTLASPLSEPGARG